MEAAKRRWRRGFSSSVALHSQSGREKTIKAIEHRVIFRPARLREEGRGWRERHSSGHKNNNSPDGLCIVALCLDYAIQIP
jgi:hypothetical protein